MPSDEEFRELKDQVASLSSALATARRRIDDLEDGMADHLGLDWGESLVDANSPHPNMSVNTIESGGGIIRQDQNGMQVKASADTQAAIWWLYTPVADTSALSGGSTNYGAIEGYVPAESGGEVSVSLTAASGGSTLASISVQADTAYARAVITGGVSFDRELVITGAISPAQITANQDDYNPTGLARANILRLSSDASRDITGLVVPDSGKVLVLFNVGAQNIVLKDESVSSTATYRFALNGDITLQPDNSVGLWYDSTSSRWRAF